jgi:penicillin-binding protein 1A
VRDLTPWSKLPLASSPGCSSRVEAGFARRAVLALEALQSRLVERTALRIREALSVGEVVYGRAVLARTRAREWAEARSRRLSRHPAFPWLAPPCTLLLVLVVLLGYFVWLDTSDLPELTAFIRFQPPSTGEVYDSDGTRLIEVAREYRHIVAYREIPEVLRNALLTAEDARFFCHHGVDYTVFPRVIWKTLAYSAAATRRVWIEERRFRPSVVFPQGGSTITQQLVRNYFLPDLMRRERETVPMSGSLGLRLLGAAVGVPGANKLYRKLEEIRLSLWLEDELARRYGSRQRAKEEVLARYASFVYLGQGRYGVAAASEYYFGRKLESYTEADADLAALLAGVTRSPRLYAPTSANRRASIGRRNQILAAMGANGSIARHRVGLLQQASIPTVQRETVKTEAPAAIDNVFTELGGLRDQRVGVAELVNGRIRIYSTINRRIQRIAAQALENGLLRYELRHPENKGLVQGSVVVLGNADARILAEVGGRRFFKDRRNSYSDFNRVTDSWRQAGSAMKPLVYLAAFRRGLTLESVVPDAPIAVSRGSDRPPKWIQNYDGKFKGPMTIRQALAESRNAATMWVARSVGIDRVLETARAFGIKSRLNRFLGTALGASEVQLLELANAYRAIASGIVAEPHVIERITDEAGHPLFLRRPPTARVPVDEPVLRSIQEALRGVVRLPGGTAHALLALPIPVMGKTGTTTGFRDALFLGSTYGAEGVTVAVRIGFDDNRPLGDSETGGRAALPIFREIVTGLYARRLLSLPADFPSELEGSINRYLASRVPTAPPESENAPLEIADSSSESSAAPADTPADPRTVDSIVGGIEPVAAADLVPKPPNLRPTPRDRGAADGTPQNH